MSFCGPCLNCGVVVDRFDKHPFKSISRQSFVVEVGDSDDANHLLGGKSALTGSVCPNCQDGLTRFFSLDLSDKRLQLDYLNLDRLEILYCWPCQLSQVAFSYQPTSDGTVNMLEVGEGPPVKDFPYPDYPRWFKERNVRLVDMQEELHLAKQQFAYLFENDRPEIRRRWDILAQDQIETTIHQFGGVPFLYDYEVPNCLRCSKEMTFLCTVEDNTWGEQGFVGAECVQVVYFICLGCTIITARNECD
jgi:hypothetical protein